MLGVSPVLKKDIQSVECTEKPAFPHTPLATFSVLQKIKPKYRNSGRFTKDEWRSQEKLSDHITFLSLRPQLRKAGSLTPGVMEMFFVFHSCLDLFHDR